MTVRVRAAIAAAVGVTAWIALAVENYWIISAILVAIVIRIVVVRHLDNEARLSGWTQIARRID